MKKFLILLVLIIACLTYLAHVTYLAIGQEITDREKLFNQRNPYLQLSSTIADKDTITADSVMFFSRKIQVYLPLYEKTILLVISATDDMHEYVFVQDKNNPKIFVRLNLPINNLAYRVDGIILTANGPGDEFYSITCKIGSGTYFTYNYHLSSGSIETTDPNDNKY